MNFALDVPFVVGYTVLVKTQLEPYIALNQAELGKCRLVQSRCRAQVGFKRNFLER
jgi:hypothetical protein